MARTSRKKHTVISESQTEAIRAYNTAIYVRLSVEDNGKESDSIESQTQMIEEYIAERPYLHKVAVFSDNGYTGTDFMRPEFMRMMEAVKDGLVNCIIVKDLSRLGRNYIEAGEFIEKICPFYGLRFISVNDCYDTATATSNSQLTVSLANIVNDYYAKDISRKVTTAMQIKMENGEYIGNYAPHGYMKDPDNKNHLVINPETAPIIQQIFQWRAEGISYMGVNSKLNNAGIPSPNQYKADHGIKTNNNVKKRRILWNKHVITDILSNCVYIGHLAQKKGSQCLYAGLPYHRTDADEWIVVKNTHEPLISEEQFNKVQSINQKVSETSRANNGKYDYLPKAINIYGKKLICADCGAVIKLYRSISTKKDRAYFTFKCPTYGEHGTIGCTDRKMRQSDFNETVLSVVKKQMDVFIDMENALDQLLAMKKARLRQSGSSQKIAAIEKKLSNKKSVFSGMYAELKEGLLTQEEYTQTRSIISADIATLEQELSELKGVKVETEEQLLGNRKWKSYVEYYYNAEEMTAEMVDAFISVIKLNSDNTLEITLNYMDEFAEIMSTCERLRKEVRIMKKQIAIYLRLSLEDVDKRTNKAKDESNSISAQRMLITRHLDQNPTLKDLPRIEFCDDGYSGTNFERPAFQKMIEMVKKGEISCIVVKDLSRFGRDYIEVGDYLEHIFPFLGIRIKAINDHYDSDKYIGRTSGMDVAFKNLIYDYYSKDLSKKVRSGMGVKQKQGRYVNCVLYGYKRSASEKHQMVIDEVTAPIVRRVFNDIICGKSTTEVAKSLNDEHIPTPAQYKGTQRGHANDLEKAPRWTHNRILEMIRNIKYTGTMVNHTRESRYIRDKNQRRVPQDEWVVRENAHEAIVSQEEYQAAQDAIRKVKGYSRTPHDTSDCVFYCGHCGHKLRKTFGSDTYFSCSSAVYQEYSKCSEIKFGKTEIEDVIFSALKAQVSLLAVQTKCTSEKLICESFSLRKTLERLQTDIDGIDREKFNRYEDYHAGEISAEAFLDEKERLNLRQSALKEELSKTQLRYDKCVQQEESTHDERMTAKKLTLISDDELRVRMYALIDKITVYANDDITISWKFDAAFADEKNTAGSIA